MGNRKLIAKATVSCILFSILLVSMPSLFPRTNASESTTPVAQRTGARNASSLQRVATSLVDPTDINPDSSDNSDPDAASGGRVNGLASVNGNNQVFYAATENGGLYKTVDGGLTWNYLVGHLPTVTWDVAVDPVTTSTVYATSRFDGRINPLSGIQVSYDGGATWTRRLTAYPNPALEGTANDNTPQPGFGCSSAAARNEPAAFGIAIRPDAPNNVFIGTNCGIARSRDGGATWEFRDPSTANGVNNAGNVYDVVVQPASAANPQGIIDICGDEGHFRSTDGGAIYTGGGGFPGGRCSIAVSPDESYVLLVAANDNNLYESDDAGATWTNLGRIDQLRGPQGRIPFVATNQRSAGGGVKTFDLWTGDVTLYRVSCITPATPAMGGTNRCPASAKPLPAGWNGPFTRSVGGHDDVGDIVFDTQAANDACPMIFSSDGGVYRNTNLGAGCQSPSWAQPNKTPHATWVWSMTGVHLPGAANEGLYYGLQDDGPWGTTTAGAATPAWHNEVCCDSFDVAAEPSRVLYSDCCYGGRATQLFLAGSGMTGSAQINSYPADGLVEAFQFGEGIANWGDKKYVVLMNDCNPPPPPNPPNGCSGVNGGDGGVYITQDITASPINWVELGTEANEPPSFLIDEVQVSFDSSGTPTFYVQAGAGNRASGGQLWKFTGTNPSGIWRRIDNNDGLVGGFNVFTVDRNNPSRLYASNVAPTGPQIVFSTDGGITWNVDPKLTRLLGGNGTFKNTSTSPQASLLAFDPDDSSIIAAGGRDSGVFLSDDSGRHWRLITDPNTPNLSGIAHWPRPLFAYFADREPANQLNLYIGTQGRGVWRISLPVPTADLSISKTSHPDPAIAGDQLFYDITVTNNGPDPVSGVRVTDTLPAGVTFVTSTVTCVENPPGTLTCEVGDLALGESQTFTIKVAISPDLVANAGHPTTIINFVQVTGFLLDDPNLSNNVDTAATIVEDLADLKVIKFSKPEGTVLAGQVVTYTIIVENLGPSTARNVGIRDEILSSGSFTMTSITPDPNLANSCSASAILGGSRVECLLLEPLKLKGLGITWTIHITVRADEPQDINDVVNVFTRDGTPDPDPSNNQAEASLHILGIADLAVSEVGLPDPAVAGTTLTYTITITNSGPSSALNVFASDFVPPQVTIISVSGGPGSSCNVGTPGDPLRPTTCYFGSITPSSSRTMTVTVKVDPSALGLIHNDVRVGSDLLDPNNSNNLATESTTIIASADLVVQKTDFPDPVLAGRPLTYELKVFNDGPSTAIGVTVEDKLPGQVDFANATLSNGTGTCVLLEIPPAPPQKKISCQLDTMLPNTDSPVFIYIKLFVKSSTPDGTTLSDRANISSSTSDPNPGNNMAVESTTVRAVADLAIKKTANADIFNPSSIVKYTITVVNLGPSDALNVAVTDSLPSNKHVEYQFDTAGCTQASLILTCNLGTLPTRASTSFNLYLTVTDKATSGIVTNSASVSSTTSDLDLTNNSAAKTIAIVPAVLAGSAPLSTGLLVGYLSMGGAGLVIVAALLQFRSNPFRYLASKLPSHRRQTATPDRL